jgi:multidrug transporter EmrE-like cation transporter
MPGHLPLLEAFPALPLLLWLVDRALDSTRAGRHRWDVAWIAIATACVVLAGHPQIPAYAVGTALLYALWRGRGWLRARLAGALILGSALSLAAWWPMLLLIQKSTRILDLDPPENDIVFPYRRILALFVPGIDGWPAGFGRQVFHGYPNAAYLFDTASYIGLAPIAAAAALLLLCCLRKRWPEGRFLFLAAVGFAAFAGALPLLDFLRHLSSAVIFRSPARLLYLTTFSLSVALGAGVDAVLAVKSRRKLVYVAVAVGLGLHGFDLGAFSRPWVIPISRSADVLGGQDQLLARTIGDGRMAADFATWSSRRRFDDIGTFDSLILAKPYRALLDLSGAAPRLNVQIINGAALARPALQAGGAVLAMTPHFRPDLLLAGSRSSLNLFSVPDPAPRASFYGPQSVKFLSEDTIPNALRTHVFTKSLILMPERSRSAVGAVASVGTVAYKRPSSDEILLDVSAGGAGFVNVVESYDPGWLAEVDGQPAEVFAADGFTLAVPVPAGKHAVRFLYSTPGRTPGMVLSLLAAGLLAGLVRLSPPVATGPSMAAAAVKPAAQPRRPRRRG